MFQHSYFNPTVIVYMVAIVDYYFVDYTKNKVCQNLYNVRVRIDNIRKKLTYALLPNYTVHQCFQTNYHIFYTYDAILFVLENTE
jgi:hypothetical protein